MMDAETRAALEWALFNHDIEQPHRAALQALLDDEKGGVSDHDSGSGGASAKQPETARSTPPDSAAKIAADLLVIARELWSHRNPRRNGYDHGSNGMENEWGEQVNLLAARIEALGLTPGEREEIKKVRGWIASAIDFGWPSGLRSTIGVRAAIHSFIISTDVPMDLERAIELGIAAGEELHSIYGDRMATYAEAAAVLRAFMEKGLLPMLLEVIDEPDKLR